MGSFNIFKPLSTFFSAAPLLNLGSIFSLWKFSGQLGMLPGAAGSGTKYASQCAMLLPNRVDVYIVNGQITPVESKLRPSLSATTLQEKSLKFQNFNDLVAILESREFETAEFCFRQTSCFGDICHFWRLLKFFLKEKKHLPTFQNDSCGGLLEWMNEIGNAKSTFRSFFIS